MRVRRGVEPSDPPRPWARYASPRRDLFWIGHLFCDGVGAGEPTVAILAERLERAPLRELASTLRGIFGLLVYERDERTWYAMVDNGGFYRLYRDREGIASSMLSLAAEREENSAIAMDKMVEYLMHGQIYGGRTLFEHIAKLRYDEVCRIPSHGPLILEKKALPSDPLPQGEILKHFDSLVVSLKTKTVSCDITGGYDTRLIVAVLDAKGLDYELAVSGWEDADDVRIARELAVAAQKPLHVAIHQWVDLEKELMDCMKAVDAQIDPVAFHRDRLNALARLGRGIEIITHGGGGGHYSDHDFVQDFPFYGSARTRFERFYDLRFAPVQMPMKCWTPDALRSAELARQRTLLRFMEHKAGTNNESYNRAAYFVRISESFGPHLSAYINMGLNVAAPFLEYDNMRACFAIPPWQRFMTRWHREVITAANPRLAKVRTAVGYTASTLPEDRLRNAIGFIGPQVRRLGRKMAQRVLGRSMFFHVGAPACDDPKFRPLVRRTRLFEEAVERLKELGIFAQAARPDDIRDHHMPAVLNAGLVLKYIAETRARSSSVDYEEDGQSVANR